MEGTKVERGMRSGVINVVLEAEDLFPSCTAFWLLVASLVRGTAVSLMQCPSYQNNGANFANLRRMTG